VSKPDGVGVIVNAVLLILGPIKQLKNRAEIQRDLEMKIAPRFTASAIFALIMGAACFGQHYAQTNLVSNVSGVALSPIPS